MPVFLTTAVFGVQNAEVTLLGVKNLLEGSSGGYIQLARELISLQILIEFLERKWLQ